MSTENFHSDELNPKSDKEIKTDVQNIAGDNLPSSNSEKGSVSNRRNYRRTGKKIANIITVNSKKAIKLERLISERAEKKAVLDRGYFIVSDKENAGRNKHVMLTTADKEVLRSKIAEIDFELYGLKTEIADNNQQIQSLATIKKSSYRDKLNREKKNKEQDKLVIRAVDGISEIVSDNGSKEEIAKIQKQALENRKEAYQSLKNFLNQKLTPIAKKINKTSEQEEKTLDKLLVKISSIQL
jgi:hypothetical protein